MKYKFLLLTGLVCLSSLFYFCSKNNPDQPQGEGPFFDFLADPLINIDTVEQGADTWEYGFVFTPLKNGRVNEFSIKMPATGDFTVTLWDLSGAAPELLGTKVLTSSAKHGVFSSGISDIVLEQGVKYGITVRSNAFYRVTKKSGAPFVFPRTIKNIRIESFNEGINNTSNAEFPPSSNDTRVTPCVNVIFIAD